MPHALAYAGYYATLGVLLPYLPAYLDGRGLSRHEIGLILSFSPFLTALTPLVGYLADESGRPRVILRAALLCSTIVMAALPSATSLAATAALMLAYAIVHPPVLVLVEAATLTEIEARGGAYARVRVVGSLAFVLVSFGLGFALDAITTAGGERTDALKWVPRLAALLLAAQLAVSFALPAPARVGGRVDLRRALALLHIPGLRVLLGASMLHWIAMAPYHALFAAHVHDLELPSRAVGVSMALGASCEIAVMAMAGRLDRRWGERRMLAIAFGSSVLRWLLCAVVTSELALVLVQVLHGLSFGAFYVAAIAAMTRLVPAELRATGQGLFIAVVFGLGGGIGTLITGAIAEVAGGAAAFLASAGISALATTVWTRFSGESTSRPHSASGVQS